MRAVQIVKDDAGQHAQLTEISDDDIGEGDVIIEVDYSAVNFKDGLGVTGLVPVVERFPIVAGIDLAGTVVDAPSESDFAPGDKVAVNGWGLAVDHNGGFATRARVPAGWLTRIPARFTTWQAMAIGTAGYTAALSAVALQSRGVTPSQGPVLVTGAVGGVGSVAVALLAALGHEVHASTGRPNEEAYLRDLGAEKIIARSELSEPAAAALGAERWAAAVDTVGSHTLVNVLAHIQYGGTVANCGLAQGLDLPGSVAPFILRAVTLVGIDSVNAPVSSRNVAWDLLDKHLDDTLLEKMTSTIPLDQAAAVAQQVLSGTIRGRTVVDVNN
ncbi:MDR family oxidoreductase [Rhodococcus sp. (in: high G+C Gram-positive bacteria)]|uniref:MDR family oxidoreductase n=1 Tax=Rhodococcus sp. TaxID=1831 RepID=UPI00257D4556|nr:MDR family oxidoreductase [Rhodococcus sp. (in: high G+C Gram-positive bacteria)]MBQ9056481.1 oxidoreductase [Rhodococcus sp. (in: high G+C Gram-positive bacteria)]